MSVVIVTSQSRPSGWAGSFDCLDQTGSRLSRQRELYHTEYTRISLVMLYIHDELIERLGVRVLHGFCDI